MTNKIIKVHPFRSSMTNIFNSFETEIENMFNNFFNETEKNTEFHPITFGKSSYPKIDISESDTKYTIEASVPGLEKDDIKVQIVNENDCKYLNILGKKKTQINDEKRQYKHKELHFSSFDRRILLNDNITEDTIDVSIKNGILYINIPKKEVTKVLPEKQVKEIYIK